MHSQALPSLMRFRRAEGGAYIAGGDPRDTRLRRGSCLCTPRHASREGSDWSEPLGTESLDF